MCESPAAQGLSVSGGDIRSLHARLADLRAAKDLFELINIGLVSREKVKGGRFTLVVSPAVRLVFCVNHHHPPTDVTGDLDWNKIYRVKLVEVQE